VDPPEEGKITRWRGKMKCGKERRGGIEARRKKKI
jgi:hypothetical protein